MSTQSFYIEIKFQETQRGDQQSIDVTKVCGGGGGPLSRTFGKKRRKKIRTRLGQGQR